ncbi:MAG: hypothetical protein L0H53_04775 [Candidatus Nitrosocosmicus sp.]|nr:hypothetical protein [Candidatus Nitrosocosmicus sp.]MDN5866604.1 hypothetical protein [Candidatus Nitrosocosmicus sp.]
MNNLKGNEDIGERMIHCALCGQEIKHSKAWPHVDGDSNLGVKKIDYFCSEGHKAEFFGS